MGWKEEEIQGDHLGDYHKQTMVARARVGAIRLSELLDKTGVKDMEVPWMMSRFGMGNCMGS